MDKDSSRNTQLTKFKTIPHINITDLLPLQEVIIVKSQSDVKTRKKRKTSPRNFVNEVESDADDALVIDLDETLNSEFPQTSVTPREFTSKFNKIMAYMDELSEISAGIEIENSKAEPSEFETLTPEKINRLKVYASLNRILYRHLRMPTIHEIITVATNMNMKEAESCGFKFNVDFDYDDNPWSELNLFNFFKHRIPLHTYRLVSGTVKFTSPSISRHIHSHLLMSGPKCNTSALMFHKRATETYFRNNVDTNAEIVDDNESIITFSYYHNVRGHKYKEFDVLSSQTLAHLTDSFRCSSQIISEDFDLGVKGSCYFINGVLYPDLRDGACDYSENLLEFYSTSKPGVLKSEVPVRQDAAVLNNLDLRLYDSGYFLHHGDCEHRLTVTNVRMFDRTRDCPIVKCYPVCTFTPNRNKLDCQICSTNEATKTVFNSLLLPNNPSHLCSDCYDHVRNIKLGSDVYFDNKLTPSIAIEYNQD
ncbi:hypothetical protein MACJ_001037 [Theileria orientalis]|uniref:snRNA-activating protein complex subunit 3 n=1 Tax=Theileria orientalis TaxID=68886 RepID=A0A976QT33_THEOR|nr:hypothetical protein MACJ_001037 [Theileria orientalis]